MRRVGGILALVLVVSLLGASDVRGGAALVPAGKTIGPALTATIVTDVTGGISNPGKGVTAIRVQKASSSKAVLFTSHYIASLQDECISRGFVDLQASTNSRFVGLANGWIDTPSVRQALLAQFGDPEKAAITDTDYVTCTTEDVGTGGVNGFGGVRKTLSFTAVFQFQP